MHHPKTKNKAVFFGHESSGDEQYLRENANFDN